MRAFGWIRLAGAVLLYWLLDALARLGARLAKGALRMDLRIDGWRYELQRRDELAQLVIDNVAHDIRSGHACGAEWYAPLKDRDLALLARAIDNLGCDASVRPRSLRWRRRDTRPTGERLDLAALPPADREAWMEAIGNLDRDGQ